MTNRRNKFGVRELLRFEGFTEEERQDIQHTLDESFEPSGSPEPTHHEPGSIEKIYVLQQRVLRGEPMFVEGDAFLTHKMRSRDEFTDKIIHTTPISLQRQSCLDSY